MLLFRRQVELVQAVARLRAAREFEPGSRLGTGSAKWTRRGPRQAARLEREELCQLRRGTVSSGFSGRSFKGGDRFARETNAIPRRVGSAIQADYPIATMCQLWVSPSAATMHGGSDSRRSGPRPTPRCSRRSKWRMRARAAPTARRAFTPSLRPRVLILDASGWRD